MQFAATLTGEVRVLADMLAAVPFGETVRYANLSAAVHFDVRQKRHILARARQKALEETGAIFDTVRGVGLRRLQAEQIPGLGAAARRRIRREAHRTHRAMRHGISGFNDVEPAVYRKYLNESAVLGLLERISTDRTMARIAARPTPLPVTAAMRNLLGT